MMTRKEFEAIAEIISGYQNAMIDNFWWEDLVNDFANYFAGNNPNFNREKFTKACDVNHI